MSPWSTPCRRGSILERDLAEQDVLITAHDLDVAKVARLEAGEVAVLDLHQPVDLRRVGHGTGDRQFAIDRVDDATLHRADLRFPKKTFNEMWKEKNNLN